MTFFLRVIRFQIKERRLVSGTEARENPHEHRIDQPESFLCQETQIVVGERAPGRRAELHVERFRHRLPRNFFGNCKGYSARLGKCVIPRDRCPSMRLLVAMDDNHDGQRQRPHLEHNGNFNNCRGQRYTTGTRHGQIPARFLRQNVDSVQ